MSPAEYGQMLAAQRPPLTDDEVETVARLIVANDVEQVAA